MFTIRPYRTEDLLDCTSCLYDGFFQCRITDHDYAFLKDYTQIMIEKSNFTYVAEVDDMVVGLICGAYKKSFSKKLAKQYSYQQHNALIIKFAIKWLLKMYRLSPLFSDHFKSFFRKIKERGNLPIDLCDCELAALTSRAGYRKGLGTALVNEMVDHCRQTGAKNIRVFTNTSSSYQFYGKYGFTLIKEKPYKFQEIDGKSMVYELQI